MCVLGITNILLNKYQLTIADSYMQLSRRALCIVLGTYLRGLLHYETLHVSLRFIMTNLKPDDHTDKPFVMKRRPISGMSANIYRLY